MRALGLIGLVVAIAVIVWIMNAVWLPSAKQAVDVKKKVEPQVQQWGGKDANGFDVRDSFTLKSDSTSGGKMKSVTVAEIAGEGALAKYFGLKKGDVIVEIAPQGGALMPVGDFATAAEAKDMLAASFSNSQQIVVLRNGQKVTLPTAPAAKSPAGDGEKAAADPVQKQLNEIKIPTH